MKIYSCYICNKNIEKNNKSYEHIIPQSIGGKKKSTRLLCQNCNKNYGKIIDKNISDSFNELCTLLNIKRERGKNPSIFLKTKSGIKYKFKVNNNPEIVKPIIQENKLNENELFLKIIAPNYKILNQVLDGLKRKYPKINKKELLEQSTEMLENIPEQFHMSFKLGGINFYKAISKIAINYCIYNNIKKSEIDNIIGFLKGNVIDNKYIWTVYFEEKKRLSSLNHILCLEGRKKDKLLFCLVYLFNTFPFFVILSETYSGNDLKYTYSINIENGKQSIDFEYNIPVNSIDIKRIVKNKPNQDEYIIQFKQLFSYFLKKNENEYIKRSVKKAFNFITNKHPNLETLNKDNFDDFYKYLWKQLQPFIVGKIKKSK